MTKTLYHYRGCSICKRAIAFVKDAGVEVTLVDLVETPPDKATLKDLWQRSGKPIDKLCNIPGMSYRDGNHSVRLKRMSEDDKLGGARDRRQARQASAARPPRRGARRLRVRGMVVDCELSFVNAPEGCYCAPKSCSMTLRWGAASSKST